MDSQDFESYLPVYDAIPEKWEEAQSFLVETLKKIANAVNIREIGWFLEEELLSGKQFVPSMPNPGNPRIARTVFRKTINTGALIVGVNPGIPHGITFDTNFTLVSLWVSGTNSGSLTALTISGNSVLMNSTNIVITSPQVFDRSFCIIEYLLEV